MAFREKLKQGFGKVGGGVKKAYQHPVTQKIGRGIKTGAQKIPGGAKTVAAGGAGLMVGLAARGGRKGRDTVGGLDLASKKILGNVFAFFAIILWIIDILPGLGGTYGGFNVDPQQFWDNWLTQFTFGNVWFDLGLTLIVIFFAIKYVREHALPSAEDMIVTSLFIITLIFFMANIGWMGHPKAILHFLFIILFGLFYVRQTDSLNMAFIVIIILLLADFFFFSTVLKFIPFLRYISLLGTIVIIWTFAQSPSPFTAFLFIGLIILIMLVTIADGTPASGILFEESEIVESPIDKMEEGARNWWDQISGEFQRRMDYAITGKVEENQFEPLGVQLVDVKAAEEKFWYSKDAADPVVVYGTVTARTLDDPIEIQVGCYLKYKGDPDYTYEIDVKPKEPFSVFTSERQDFVCSFQPCDLDEEDCILKEGSNMVTTFADFNFETLAYLKTYFMENERLRAMRREGIEDVLGEFKIKDKDPIAVYTNGPVEIGMETTTALIGVREEYGNNYPTPTLSISLQNRRGWQGEITRLDELVLFIPKNIILEEGPRCEFIKYKESDCLNSCDENSKKCEGSFCDEKKKECQKICKSLFQECNVYNLTVNDLREGEELDEVEFFRCNFDPSGVLENTPITTKYFRVKSRYEYRVEKPATVKIERLPELEEGDESEETSTESTKTEETSVEETT